MFESDCRGEVLAHEKEHNFQAAKAQYLSKEAKLDRQHARENAKRQQVLAATRPPPPVFSRKSMCVSSDIDNASVKKQIKNLGMVVTDHRPAATFFLVENPAEPGGRNSWVLALNGGFALDAEYLKSSGKSGNCVQYLPSAGRLWLSADFTDKHADLVHLLSEIFIRTSKWTWFEGVSEDFSEGSRRRPRHSGMTLYGLVTIHEKKTRPGPRLQHRQADNAQLHGTCVLYLHAHNAHTETNKTCLPRR